MAFLQLRRSDEKDNVVGVAEREGIAHDDWRDNRLRHKAQIQDYALIDCAYWKTLPGSHFRLIDLRRSRLSP